MGINEEFNIYQSFNENISYENYQSEDYTKENKKKNHEKQEEDDLCLKMKKFVELNKFPILKKLDQNYLTKIQREKKIMIIAAINRSDNQHISFLNNYFHYQALENRENLIFSYLDFKEDKYFFNFFNIDLSKFSNENKNSIEYEIDLKPIIIIYNFKINKFYVDPNSFSDEKNYLRISDNKQLKALIENIEKNNIRWTSGYLLEDIFTDILGSDVSREKLLMIYSGIFFVILGVIVIFVCSCFEEKGKKKIIKQFGKKEKIKHG